MLLAVIALVAGGVAGLLLGGRPRPLARTRLRGFGLLVVGAAAEVVGSYWATGPAATAILVAGYVVLAGFALLNGSVAGMVLIAAGLAANALVVGINGGMPVRGVAPSAPLGARHHGERPADRLTILGDVVRIAPLHQTVSAGDIVLATGVAVTVVTLLGPAAPRRRRTVDVTG
jgi:hypothetical protein